MQFSLWRKPWLCSGILAFLFGLAIGRPVSAQNENQPMFQGPREKALARLQTLIDSKWVSDFPVPYQDVNTSATISAVENEVPGFQEMLGASRFFYGGREYKAKVTPERLLAIYRSKSPWRSSDGRERTWLERIPESEWKDLVRSLPFEFSEYAAVLAIPTQNLSAEQKNIIENDLNRIRIQNPWTEGDTLKRNEAWFAAASRILANLPVSSVEKFIKLKEDLLPNSRRNPEGDEVTLEEEARYFQLYYRHGFQQSATDPVFAKRWREETIAKFSALKSQGMWQVPLSDGLRAELGMMLGEKAKIALLEQPQRFWVLHWGEGETYSPAKQWIKVDVLLKVLGNELLQPVAPDNRLSIWDFMRIRFDFHAPSFEEYERLFSLKGKLSLTESGKNRLARALNILISSEPADGDETLRRVWWTAASEIIDILPDGIIQDSFLRDTRLNDVAYFSVGHDALRKLYFLKRSKWTHLKIAHDEDIHFSFDEIWREFGSWQIPEVDLWLGRQLHSDDRVRWGAATLKVRPERLRVLLDSCLDSSPESQEEGGRCLAQSLAQILSSFDEADLKSLLKRVTGEAVDARQPGTSRFRDEIKQALETLIAQPPRPNRFEESLCSTYRILRMLETEDRRRNLAAQVLLPSMQIFPRAWNLANSELVPDRSRLDQNLALKTSEEWADRLGASLELGKTDEAVRIALAHGWITPNHEVYLALKGSGSLPIVTPHGSVAVIRLGTSRSEIAQTLALIHGKSDFRGRYLGSFFRCTLSNSQNPAKTASLWLEPRIKSGNRWELIEIQNPTDKGVSLKRLGE